MRPRSQQPQPNLAAKEYRDFRYLGKSSKDDGIVMVIVEIIFPKASPSRRPARFETHA